MERNSTQALDYRVKRKRPKRKNPIRTTFGARSPYGNDWWWTVTASSPLRKKRTSKKDLKILVYYLGQYKRDRWFGVF